MDEFVGRDLFEPAGYRTGEDIHETRIGEVVDYQRARISVMAVEGLATIYRESGPRLFYRGLW